MFTISSPCRFITGGILSVGVALGALSNVCAASLLWDQTGGGGLGGTGTWNTAATNWWNGTSDVAWSDTMGTVDTATFAGTAGTVTLGTNLGARGLVFGTTGYTIATGANTLTLGFSGIDASGLSTGTTTISGNLALGASQIWNVGSGATLTASAVVNGSGFGITKSGAGTLTLQGANTYTGRTTVSAGTLVLDFSAAGAPASQIISSGSALTLGGGTLNIIGKNGATTAQTFAGTTLTANTASTLTTTQNGATALNVTLGAISRNGTGTLDITLPTTGTVTTSVPGINNGVVVDAGSNWANFMTVNGGQTWAGASGGNITAFDSYTTSLAGGTYTTHVDVTSTQTAASAFTVADLRFNTNGVTLTLGAANNNIDAGGILVTPGTTATIDATGGGSLYGNGGGKKLTIFDYGNLTISAPITQTANGVIFTGTGTTTLSGANTYTGATYINQGTVKAGIASVANSSGAFGNNSAVNMGDVSGATLDLNGFDNQIGSLNGGGTNGGNVTLGTATLTVGGGNGTGTYSGVISGTGGLTKTGTGTQTLTGANTYTGATTINGGTLQIGNGGTTGSLSTSSAITNNGTLAFNRTDTVTQGIDFSGSAIGGTGALIKAGSGTLVLTAANTYTGTTTIQGGTLTVGNGTSGSLGTGALTFANTGTVNFNEAAGSSQSMGALTVSAGAGATVQSTYGGSGNTSLTFSNVVGPRNTGSTANFVVSGGTNGTTNKIVFTQVAGATPSTGTLLDRGYFYNGSSYAAYDTGGFVRAYGSGDTNYVTAAGSNSIANVSTNNVALTGNVDTQASAAINTLNMGANTLALDTGAAFQTNGILVSGNNASTISGGASLTATTNGAEMVVRVDGSSDALDISTPIIANGSNAFTKTGAGTLTLSGSNSYTGATTIHGGTLQIGSAGSLGSGSYAGAIAIGGTLQYSSSAAQTLSGVISGSGALTKDTSGTSTLTLSGNNSYTGGTNINAGTVSATVANALGTVGTVTVGSSGTLNLSAGAATIYGFASLSGSGIVNVTVGTGNQGTEFKGGTGFTGTINIGTGAAAGAGKAKINNATLGAGSTINVATNATLYYAQANTLPSNITLNGGDTGESLGQLRLENSAIVSGNVTLAGDITGAGDFTIGITVGTGTISGNIGESGGSRALSKGGNGTMILGGANTYTGATTIGAGTLRLANSLALQNSTLNHTGAALVFDSSVGSHAFTFGGLTGTSNIALTDNGSNAVALTVGNNNTSPAAYSGILSGGGSLTKIGTGTLTLSGASTYTGATTVNGGTLLISGTGGINGSSGITVNGSGAKFVHASSTAGTVPVTLTQGTLDGTGTIGPVTVSNGTGGILTNGNGGTSTLTVASLTFNGAGTMNLNKSGDTFTPALSIEGAFTTTPANGQITLNLLTGPSWTNGDTYNLISYGSFSGANTDFTLGTVAGLGIRQSATIGNTGPDSGFITLFIDGDTPVWTGAANGNWTTVAQPSPFNWKLQTAGTGTQFLTNDQVLFNDTATGTTAINIADASVSPASTIFDNSSKNYSISSSGGFGIASGFLVKGGSGSLTLNTANTYSGGTTLNAGTLNINNASAIGTGALTIAGGTTIDNTSGSAITLSTSNAQFWNGDFTFGGSNDLNLGTGAVTLGASVFLTTDGSATLTVGGVIGGNGFFLVKDGPGTLVLNGANTFDGGVTINTGTLRVGNASALGTSTNPLSFGLGSDAKLQVNGIALAVSGIEGDNTATIENANAANGTLNVNGAFGGTFDGTIQDGGAGTLTLVKSGAGILTLTGANTYTGGTTLNGGTLSVGGNSALGTGSVTVNGGTISSASAAVLANAITLNGAATFSAASDTLTINGNITGTPTGNLFLTPTNTITLAGTNSLTFSANNLGLLTSAGSVDITGSTTIDGGAFTNSGYATIGNASSTTLTILSGGSLEIKGTTGGKPGTIVGQNANSSSTLNVGAADKSSSGTLKIGGNTAFILGNNNVTASGTLNVNSGTATITAGSTTLQDQLNFIAMGRDDGTGIINLDGGTLATGRQFVRDGSAGGTQGTGTAIFNFNGGVLQAQANQTQGNGWFETAITGNFQVVTTNVADGGAIIDTNGFNVNINTALVHAGVNAVDGGLTKNGAGVLSLGGTNTFTGNAVVNAGTLSLATNVSLDDTIVLSLASGTTLDLAFASGSETLGGLLLDGVAVEPGTYTAAELDLLGASASIDFTSTGGTLTVVPEPSTVALVALGLLGCLFAFRRTRFPTNP